jgi:hypothetical protein
VLFVRTRGSRNENLDLLILESVDPLKIYSEPLKSMSQLNISLHFYSVHFRYGDSILCSGDTWINTDMYPSSLMCGPNKVNSGYIAIENSVDGKYV